ncbi:MAG: DUF2237 domain-containing protein [Leptospiraceae bacterium]|nr:DUF2237 domain-containing protein [Leptospiraceae bacterium]
MALNVLGTELQICSQNPVTGFYRNGCCDTGPEDRGLHTVCALMSAEFLEFSRRMGNDLSTPAPHFGFPGLKANDRWCLCMLRWLEALEHNMAPQVYLAGTHISVIEHIDMETLRQYALDA